MQAILGPGGFGPEQDPNPAVPAQRSPNAAEDLPSPQNAPETSEARLEAMAVEAQTTDNRSLLWQLFAEYRPEMIRVASRFLRNRGQTIRLTPEDLAHQAMFRIVNGWDNANKKNRSRAIPRMGL